MLSNSLPYLLYQTIYLYRNLADIMITAEYITFDTLLAKL